jgi:hypothetical protein
MPQQNLAAHFHVLRAHAFVGFASRAATRRNFLTVGGPLCASGPDGKFLPMRAVEVTVHHLLNNGLNARTYPDPYGGLVYTAFQERARRRSRTRAPREDMGTSAVGPACPGRRRGRRTFSARTRKNAVRRRRGSRRRRRSSLPCASGGCWTARSDRRSTGTQRVCGRKPPAATGRCMVDARSHFEGPLDGESV